MSDMKQSSNATMKGWLYKWTNYIKGYQKRWFVLCNGLLSYYRNQAEMSQTCRGTISLESAVIHTEDSLNFVITSGGTHTFHLKAMSEFDKQRWVTALELAKARAIRSQDSEDEEDANAFQCDKQELYTALKPLQAKLDDLITCHDLVVKHGSALQRLLIEIENCSDPAEAASRCRTLNERATLFRITTTAIIHSCSDYLSLIQTNARKWQKLIKNEHELRVRLEEMVEQLAKQHSVLERRAKEVAYASSPNVNSSANSDDEEFFDAEETATEFYVPFPGKAHRVLSAVDDQLKNVEDKLVIDDDDNGRPSVLIPSASSGDFNSETAILDNESSGSDDNASEFNAAARVIVRPHLTDGKTKENSYGDISTLGNNHRNDNDRESNTSSSSTPGTPIGSLERKTSFPERAKRVRRTKIPYRPNHSLNLWSIMKNCIGKELSKIPMPVNFNEPLSMLQRITEDFEYSDLLHKAARIKDSCDQLVYIAAFCVSHYASTSNRTGKPFNPLLGETFEFDRTDDLGWRTLVEQVSHHPPMLAMYTQGHGWNCWAEYGMSSKFRGKYLQIMPIDITHLEFPKLGYEYTWRKVITTVHNIIVGKLWVDNHGDMTITNHKTGDKCHLKFIPYSFFSREMPRKVTGVIIDSEGTAKWVLQGTWDTKLEASRVLSNHGSTKGKPILETATPKVVWKRNSLPPESDKMYNFSSFAITLNEHEESVAPTDSRLRPDQRAMENADWDEANRLKGLLEEKQRGVRRRREAEAELAATEGKTFEPYEPIWFKKQKDPITGNLVHVYTGQYWEAKEKQDWSRSPDIFLSEEAPDSGKETK